MGQAPSNEQTEAISPGVVSLPNGVKRMAPELQKRFQSGQLLNLKILIRGDRGTGKTSLLRRLEGTPFVEEHFPTPEIQVTNIPWNYKVSDESVKCEIWDVVDQGLKKPVMVNANSPGERMDASFGDIYRGAHAVILMVDPTRRWTLDYVEELIPQIPEQIVVLIMINFQDLSKRHVLTRPEMERFMLKQGTRVRCLYASLKDCYGLKELYNFINIPFLNVKCFAMQGQLRRLDEECRLACDEADTVIAHQDYERYLKAQAVSAAAAQIPSQRLSVTTSSLTALQNMLPLTNNTDLPTATAPSPITLHSATDRSKSTPEMESGVNEIDSFNPADSSDRQQLNSITKAANDGSKRSIGFFDDAEDTTRSRSVPGSTKVKAPDQVSNLKQSSSQNLPMGHYRMLSFLCLFIGAFFVFVYFECLPKVILMKSTGKSNRLLKARGMLVNEEPLESRLATTTGGANKPASMISASVLRTASAKPTVKSEKANLDSFFDEEEALTIKCDTGSAGPSFDDFEADDRVKRPIASSVSTASGVPKMTAKPVVTSVKSSYDEVSGVVAEDSGEFAKQRFEAGGYDVVAETEQHSVRNNTSDTRKSSSKTHSKSSRHSKTAT